MFGKTNREGEKKDTNRHRSRLGVFQTSNRYMLEKTNRQTEKKRRKMNKKTNSLTSFSYPYDSSRERDKIEEGSKTKLREWRKSN
jgi:hypothetical protein